MGNYSNNEKGEKKEEEDKSLQLFQAANLSYGLSALTKCNFLKRLLCFISRCF